MGTWFRSIAATLLLIAASFNRNDSVADDHLTFGASVNETQRVMATEAFNKMCSARRSLGKGEFRASGTVTYASDKASIQGPLSLFAAFDYGNDLLRFDRQQLLRSPPSTGKSNIAKETLIIHKDKATFWSGDASRGGRTFKRGMPDSDSVFDQSFDVRTIGLAMAFEGREQSIADFEGLARRQEVIAVASPHPGVVSIEWLIADGRLRRVMSINSNQGWSPTYVGYRSRLELEETILEEATTWTDRDGVWVPKSSHLMRREWNRDGRTDVSYDLDFTWLKVNDAPKAHRYLVGSPIHEGAPRSSNAAVK